MDEGARAELRAAFADVRRSLDRLEGAIEGVLSPAPAKPAPAPPEPAPPAPPPAPPAAPAEDLVDPGHVSRPIQAAALKAFPVDDLNRWLASGTVYQIRGEIAYLNLRAMGGEKIDEMKGHIRRMGFDLELGPLAAEGLSGEVCLFRRSAG